MIAIKNQENYTFEIDSLPTLRSERKAGREEPRGRPGEFPNGLVTLEKLVIYDRRVWVKAGGLKRRVKRRVKRSRTDRKRERWTRSETSGRRESSLIP